MSKSPAQIEKRIESVKRKLAELGPMRPGSLSQQYRDPETRKKPFHQISYTHRGKSRSEYVRTENLARIKREIAMFKKFRDLTEEWVELSLELSRQRSGAAPAKD